MVLHDFLSRQKHDDSNPYEIIPITFNVYNMLHETYYNLGLTDKYLVQTWSQTESSRIILPEVHGLQKILDTNILPEKQKTAPKHKKGSEIKPQLRQGRVGIKHKNPKLLKILMNWQTNCRKYLNYLQPKT